MSAFRCPPVVEVDWIDSMAHPGWRRGEEAVVDMDRIDDMRHRTCGYLVKRTDVYIGLALSIGWSGTLGDTIQIPEVAVRRVRTLRRGDYDVPDERTKVHKEK